MKWLVRQKKEPQPDARERVPLGDAGAFKRLEERTGKRIVAWERGRGKNRGDWLVTLAAANQTEPQTA